MELGDLVVVASCYLLDTAVFLRMAAPHGRESEGQTIFRHFAALSLDLSAHFAMAAVANGQRQEAKGKNSKGDTARCASLEKIQT